MHFLRQQCDIIFPVILILSLSAAGLFIPNKTFSKNEMRYLTQPPQVNVESIVSRKYSEKFEAYYSE